MNSSCRAFVESFYVAVHLRSLGVGVVMSQMKLFQFFSKVFLEFGTIVGQHIKKVERIRKHFKAQFKEFLSGFGDVGLSCPGKAKASVYVLKSNHIPTAAVNYFFYCV